LNIIPVYKKLPSGHLQKLEFLFENKEAERRRKPKPSVQALHKELSTELTPLSDKKAIFRDALQLELTTKAN